MIKCGLCGTELIDDPKCSTTAMNKTWCPKCQCYPSSSTYGVCGVAGYSVALIGISQEEYNRLKAFEQKIEQLKAALDKARKAILSVFRETPSQESMEYAEHALAAIEEIRKE